jgi:hypothetical protein
MWSNCIMVKSFLKGILFISLILGLTSQVCTAQEKAPVSFKIESKKVSATGYDIAFNATIDEGWHVYFITQTAAGLALLLLP